MQLFFRLFLFYFVVFSLGSIIYQQPDINNFTYIVWHYVHNCACTTLTISPHEQMQQSVATRCPHSFILTPFKFSLTGLTSQSSG